LEIPSSNAMLSSMPGCLVRSRKAFQKLAKEKGPDCTSEYVLGTNPAGAPTGRGQGPGFQAHAALNRKTQTIMMNDIILQAISTKDLEDLLRKLVRAEFEAMNEEIQRVMGEDDLVSTGTACRILGISTKVFKVLLDQGHFTVFYHLKERRIQPR
jgi:hypothetical protein